MVSTRKEIKETILETLRINGRTYWELAGEVFVKYNNRRDRELESFSQRYDKEAFLKMMRERWLGWSDYLVALSEALNLEEVLAKEQSDGERKGSIIYSLGESVVTIGTA